MSLAKLNAVDDESSIERPSSADIEDNRKRKSKSDGLSGISG